MKQSDNGNSGISLLPIASKFAVLSTERISSRSVSEGLRISIRASSDRVTLTSYSYAHQSQAVLSNETRKMRNSIASPE